MKKIMRIFLLFTMVFVLTACGVKSSTDAAGSEQTIENGLACTLEIRCDSILANMDKLDPEKTDLVPEDGILFPETEVYFEDGESVFDVFRRTLKNEKIHFEYVDAKAYNSVYIEGIGNLYEFDCGAQSGWMYSVNGIFPGLGCSDYKLSEGDKIVFSYTCDMGADVGAEYEE